MRDRLYTEYPGLYDAIQSWWDYDRDVAFAEAALERHDVAGDRLLEIGCGTGEHAKRFVEAGYDVTAIDPAAGMLSLERSVATTPVSWKRACRGLLSTVNSTSSSPSAAW
jgi:ubiquinone/menaquinone biosynthesis C-methylase UbiE